MSIHLIDERGIFCFVTNKCLFFSIELSVDPGPKAWIWPLIFPEASGLQGTRRKEELKSSDCRLCSLEKGRSQEVLRGRQALLFQDSWLAVCLWGSCTTKICNARNLGLKQKGLGSDSHSPGSGGKKSYKDTCLTAPGLALDFRCHNKSPGLYSDNTAITTSDWMHWG